VAGNVYGLRLLRRPAVRDTSLVVIAAILLVTRLIQVLSVEKARLAFDFKWYWVAAGQLLNGESIYSAQQLGGPYAPQGQEGFLYPPPLAALVTPFYLASPSDPLPAAAIWSLLAAVVAVASILALARNLRLAERFPTLAGRRIVLLLIAAFALPEVIDELINGNVHLFLLGLFTLAWLGISRGDARGEAVAGVAIGVATVIKIFPGLVLVWFIVTGRWRGVGWAVVGALALSLLTLPMTGIQPWLDFPTVLRNMAAPTDPSASFAPTMWLAPVLGFALARVVVTVLGVAIVAWSALRQSARTSFAVAVLASVLITPALWSHYLSMIVLPLLVALGSGVSLLVLGLDYVFLSAEAQDALGPYAWILARAVPTIGELLLLVVLLMIGRRRTATERVAAPA
jgi:Glycosyltransferase family 87